MSDTCFLSGDFDGNSANAWVQGCATRSGWSEAEARRLASCVADSARAVSERAYCLSDTGPVFVKLDVNADDAILEMHHEGALGDKPCDCAASKVASERKSTDWRDAQLRTHRLRIERA
jgi:hypothetical protein